MKFTALKTLRLGDRVLQLGDPVSGVSRPDLDRMVASGLVRKRPPTKHYTYTTVRRCRVGSRVFEPGTAMVGVKKNIIQALERLGRIERQSRG